MDYTNTVLYTVPTAITELRKPNLQAAGDNGQTIIIGALRKQLVPTVAQQPRLCYATIPYRNQL